MTRTALGATVALVLGLVLLGSGCGGIAPQPETRTTTVIVETLKAGTQELLEVAATVIVQGVRGEVNLSDGWAILRDVPLGNQEPPRGPMTVTAPGYVTVSRIIELSKYSYTPVSVEMEPADPATTGSVKGRVTSTTGLPLTSALVKFHKAVTSGEVEVAGYTDSEGRYTVGGVPSGEVTVQAQAAGYVAQTRAVVIRPDAVGANPDIDFVLLPGDTRVRVRGDVTSLVTGAPIAGAEVSIAGLPAVVTGAAGQFEVADVPIGVQAIRATAAGHDDYNSTIAVAPGMDPVHVLMTPVSPEPPSGPYTITGTVTLLGRPDNSGALVSAFETSRGIMMGSYTTGPDGIYSLFVPPGQYRIEASFGDEGISRDVTLRVGRVLAGIDFVLAP